MDEKLFLRDIVMCLIILFYNRKGLFSICVDYSMGSVVFKLVMLIPQIVDYLQKKACKNYSR